MEGITVDEKDMVNIRLWNVDFLAFLVIWGPMEAASRCDIGFIVCYRFNYIVIFNDGGGTLFIGTHPTTLPPFLNGFPSEFWYSMD
jgi:hypothetical protein